MIKITVKVDGMVCGMCETNINEMVKKVFDVKKITTSHARRETVILTEENIDDQELKDIIGQAGYGVISIDKEEYKKKRLFGKLFG